MSVTRRGALLAVVALVCLLVGFAFATDGDAGDPPPASPSGSPDAAGAAGAAARIEPSASGPSTAPRPRPNIVFVLTDDLDSSLVQYMPKLNQFVRDEGLQFDNYFVSSAVCCPSRVSMLRGQLPHNTTVLTNEDGFMKFHRLGLESSTIATWLQSAGYRTALMGKYLNGYLEARGAGLHHYVPPGWSEWHVIGDGYREYDYTMNRNGSLVAFGHEPQHALTDVLRNSANAFITDSVGRGQPFFLTVSAFAPHAPYAALDRYAMSYPGVSAPRPPSFNARGQGEPRWLAAQPSLTPAAIASIDAKYRKRVQAVQGVDELIGDVVTTLQRAGVLDDTYIVFASDNGYHLGQHRLQPGKQTAYDSDIRVPLIVRGPGVARGSTTAPALNIDLAPTFAALGGATPPSFVDGRSLEPLLRGTTPANWRDTVFIEHEGPLALPGDPDYQPDDNPTRYVALRTADHLFVVYHSGERELYDYGRDPYELDNRAGAMSPDQLARYERALEALARCRGDTCFVRTGL